MMELRQLRYFLAVAESGNFSRAALRLHVSQPPLSTQIKNLEQELGIRLFDRDNRGATLTAAGLVFRDEVRPIVERLEQARRKARLAGHGEVGSITVGFVSIVDFGVLPPALRSFRAARPLVEVQLHELTTDAQMRELRAGRLDVGIALGPVDEPDLRFEPLLSESLIAALPTGHALAKRHRAVALEQIARENFIVPPRDIAPGLHDLVLGSCRSSGFVPRITQYARQMQTVISLVAAGMGCALVPASVGQLRRPGVQYRPLRGKAARVEIGILKGDVSRNPAAEYFRDALRKAARAEAAGRAE